jgi:hypothetical protein
VSEAQLREGSGFWSSDLVEGMPVAPLARSTSEHPEEGDGQTRPLSSLPGPAERTCDQVGCQWKGRHTAEQGRTGRQNLRVQILPANASRSGWGPRRRRQQCGPQHARMWGTIRAEAGLGRRRVCGRVVAGPSRPQSLRKATVLPPSPPPPLSGLSMTANKILPSGFFAPSSPVPCVKSQYERTSCAQGRRKGIARFCP